MHKIVFIGLFCLLLLPASAYGHKLIPTDGTNIDYESALEIPNPVISWAMYEELEDNPLFYKFVAKKNDRLYSSIVIPKLDNLEKFTPSLVLIGPSTFLDLVDELKVLDNNKNFDYSIPEGYDAYVFDYNGSIPSKEFYEPFGQITYWERQEIDLEIQAPGTYYMAVFDKTGSSGKLALAIGYVEDFSGNDFVTVLPNAWLESRYFSEDFTPLFVLVGVLSGIFTLIGFLIYRKIKRK
ncbi:MAG: hypothetical protein O3C04_02905 [Crenarchaeota archaeon]|nr:hypothetical protein [Thermoproteota archaeon]MDA1124577.1 hypothetical protein [Thermoproteota archaeon]